MAAKAHQATDENRKSVKAMAAYGIPHVDIATAIGATAKTLRKYYRPELNIGHISANAAVVGALYKQATGGNVTAAIFWTKARMGWSDRGLQPHDSDTVEETARSIHDTLQKMEERTNGGSD